MSELASLTPLGAATARTDRIGAITIAEEMGVALASVTCRLGQEAAFRAAAETLFATTLPAPGTCAQGPVFGLIWTAPDQCFVEASYDAFPDLARSLKAALGATASVTEQTDGWARFDIAGPKVVDMLERLCPAPSRQMQTGAATRSLMDHMGVLLICRAAQDRFTVLGPRSYAASLHHALVAAAQSVA